MLPSSAWKPGKIQKRSRKTWAMCSGISWAALMKKEAGWAAMAAVTRAIAACTITKAGSAPFVAHIHEKIDFTVSIFVVEHRKVLLIHHRNLNQWLPLGGHIELDEDPETAAYREAFEESGLEIELVGERPPTTGSGTRALIAP